MILPFNLDLINPKQGKKYSPELFKWLKKSVTRLTHLNLKVYRDNDTETLWIGGIDDEDCFWGSHLYSAMVSGSKKVILCFSKGQDLIEISDFWDNYLKIGRCAIDSEHKKHFINEHNDRWSYVNDDHRKCLWCGAQQKKVVTERIVKDEKWV